jgi:hypothetical protein
MYMLKLVRGCLTIRAEDSACSLWLDDRCLGDFVSAGAAAEFVARRRTGHVEIDAAPSLPSDVEGWRWISLREIS